MSVELWTILNCFKYVGMAGFYEHDDNDDAVTAANVEGRLSIMTVVHTAVGVFDYLMTLLDVQNLLLHRTK